MYVLVELYGMVFGTVAGVCHIAWRLGAVFTFGLVIALGQTVAEGLAQQGEQIKNLQREDTRTEELIKYNTLAIRVNTEDLAELHGGLLVLQWFGGGILFATGISTILQGILLRRVEAQTKPFQYGSLGTVIKEGK